MKGSSRPANANSFDELIARPIAHRGLHDAANGIVENTHSAFAAAIERGYAIECDLQLSGDGEAMVFHDVLLDRLTESAGPVAGFPAAKLGQIGFSQGQDTMQTLGELLAQVGGRTPLFLELKSLWDGNAALARRACAVVEGYDGPLALMSFDPELMLAVKEVSPDLQRGLVIGPFHPENWPEFDEHTLHRLRGSENIVLVEPDFLSMSVELLNGAYVKAFRATGRPVICWTVRSRQVAKDSLLLCDQITFEGFSA